MTTRKTTLCGAARAARGYGARPDYFDALAYLGWDVDGRPGKRKANRPLENNTRLEVLTWHPADSAGERKPDVIGVRLHRTIVMNIIGEVEGKEAACSSTTWWTPRARCATRRRR